MMPSSRPSESIELPKEDFKRLYESSPGNFLVLNPGFVIVAVTDAYLSATMTRREAILGRHIFDVFPDNPSDPEATGVRNLKASLEAVLKFKSPNRMDIQKYDIRVKDSSEFEERFWSPLNTPILNDLGEIAFIIHQVEDVTEMVRLGRSETDLDRFFSMSMDLLCIAGADGMFKRVNPAFTETLGWSKEELLTRPFLDFVHPEDHERTIAEVERKITTGVGALHFENRIQHKNGEWKIISWNSMPQPDGLMFVTGRDVTQDKADREELQLARQEAERANLAKSEFLSRMSHELRTPLNGVIGYSQLLTMFAEDAKTMESAQSILNSGRHLLSLINEILDLARIEAGKLTLSLEPVPIQYAINQAMKLILPLLDKAKITLEVKFELNEDAHVMADSQRLTQILVNLISNATKFNRENGKISIRCFHHSETHIRIEISDTGHGIDAHKIDNLFKPFERLGDESTEGTGLGLALSNSLATLMGGQVTLKESSPEGSTFAIVLARAVTPAESLDDAKAAVTDLIKSTTGCLRVIYIEDNLSNLKLITRVFDELGDINLMTAMDASSGIVMVEEYLPDLVLLDLHLPDRHGYEVLRRLKANPRARTIPVIIISADATRKQMERLMAAGARAYLTKPIELRALFEQIELIRSELYGKA